MSSRKAANSRRGDLLRLRVQDIRDDGLHVTTRKTGRAIVYEWSDELRVAVELPLSARKRVYGLTVFATREGQPYITPDGRASAWHSLWQRFMAKVLAKTKVAERFTEHARMLLAHADAATTQRVYRRRPQRVKPLR